jgi:hypothetical protein
MGPSFMVVDIAWPDHDAPDWDALLAAAAKLSPELADRVNDEHQLWEPGLEEDKDDDIRYLAAAEVTDGIEELRAALAGGARHLTVVQPDRWTVVLDGGVSGGEEPSDTWYSIEALAVTGLLGQSLGYPAPEAAVPRQARPWADELATIDGPPRLIVVAFPAAIDWDQARSLLPDDERSLERLMEVLDGGYSRRARALPLGDTALLLGDRGDPSGVAASISIWQRAGVLDAIGAQILEDIRLPQSTNGEHQ